jgi:predicted AlkP superfamily phosphohydrolase/phosphomutase
VVVLGFDAMDPTIARSLAEAGRLPTFRSFFEDGATAAVGSPPGLVVGSVWPSFWTGVWPSEHGFYCFVQLVNGTYTVRRFNSDDVDGVPFWMTLARAGQRVAAVDVPICPLTCPDDGVHVVD